MNKSRAFGKDDLGLTANEFAATHPNLPLQVARSPRRQTSVRSANSFAVQIFKLSLIKSLLGRFPFFPAKRAEPPPSSTPASAPAREWPSPVLAWVGRDKTIALRSFDWENDADFICSWQRETYAINFPDFKLSLEFSGAFRHDLRRAFLDGNHALWMLDDPESSACGFIWVVLCTNSWTNERYGYVNNLFIEASHRGQHLGEELLEHAAKWFKARKVDRLRLTVTSSNASAVRLYERAGFVVERLEMERGL